MGPVHSAGEKTLHFVFVLLAVDLLRFACLLQFVAAQGGGSCFNFFLNVGNRLLLYGDIDSLLGDLDLPTDGQDLFRGGELDLGRQGSPSDPGATWSLRRST